MQSVVRTKLLLQALNGMGGWVKRMVGGKQRVHGSEMCALGLPRVRTLGAWGIVCALKLTNILHIPRTTGLYVPVNLCHGFTDVNV